MHLGNADVFRLGVFRLQLLNFSHILKPQPIYLTMVIAFDLMN